MSRTLNLLDILLTSARHLFMMGRFTEALVPLAKLTGFRSLPDHINEETQSLLAEIYLQQKKYKDARRHLTAAIALKPSKGEYCYLMAVAIEEDDRAERGRAELYYSRAIELEPNEPTYRADFGSYLFNVGKTRQAFAEIRKAYTLGICDAEIVGQVAQVLRREGQLEEATTKLRAALFHSHGAADFRRLWQQHQFALIHARQNQRRESAGYAEPVLLPFTPAPHQGKYLALGGKTIRIDQPEPLDEPRKRDPQPYRRPPKKG
jgi:Flp pilus assembly protein TadD